jgi:hypothetical protein
MGGEHGANESPSNAEKPAKDGRFPHWRKAIGWVLAVGSAFVIALATGVAGKIVNEFWGNHPDASVTATEVRFVQPFDVEGNLQAPFEADKTKTISGGLCIDSIASTDPESMRCVEPDNLIHDPCWASNRNYQVACPDNPWDKTIWLVLNPAIERTRSPEPSSTPPTTCSERPHTELGLFALGL